MASCLQAKSHIGDEAENSLLESLSFAGLLSIQDQKPKSPPTVGHQTRKQHSDFAFHQTRHDSDTADLSKYQTADLLISNGKILPQAFVFHQKQRPPQRNTDQPQWKGSSASPLAQRKRSAGDKSGSKEGSNRKKQNQRNQTKMEPNNTSGSALGWKLFKSFVSPCRECRAVKTATKTQTMPRESFKLH